MKNIPYIYQKIKKMNRVSLLILILVFPSTLFSQAPFPEPEEVESFYNTKTLVVLENDMFSSYNSLIKDAMKEYWEAGEYDFISTSEFNEKRRDPSFSFIVLTGTTFDRDRSGMVYNFINLLLGKDVGRIEYMPELCALPLSIKGAEDTDYSHKLGMVIRFMQAHVDHIREDPSQKGKKYLKYYNKFIPDAINKTILVSEKDLEPELRTPGAAEKLYPENLSVVTEDEVDEAIRNRAEDTMILHKVGSDRGGLCFKMLIGTDDARMYFYGEHKISGRRPDGLLKNDLRRIGRF